jgi:phosphoribosylformylglycinamidine cyclo-ligase
VPSSGIHSNGLSLARKVLPTAEWEELLIPTEIYVSLLSELTEHRLITGAAHVTGGGLVANTQRVLPEGTAAHFTWDWDRPAIFQRIQECGSVEESEMRAAFNMGIGLVLVCDSDRAEQVLELCRRHGYTAQEVGTVEEKAVQGAAVEEADSVGPWGGRNRG